MKNVVNRALVAKKKYLLSLFFALCSVTLFAAKADKQVVVLSCDLHCQGCCDKIMKNIAFEKGVKDLVCDLKTKTVTVTFDTNKTDLPTLLKAFEKIGKPAKVKEPVESQKSKVESQKPEKAPKPESPKPEKLDAETGASQLQ